MSLGDIVMFYIQFVATVGFLVLDVGLFVTLIKLFKQKKINLTRIAFVVASLFITINAFAIQVAEYLNWRSLTKIEHAELGVIYFISLVFSEIIIIATLNRPTKDAIKKLLDDQKKDKE